MWILNQSVKTLCRKEMPLVKVLWSWVGVEEATLQLENEVRRCFPRFLQADNVISGY